MVARGSSPAPATASSPAARVREPREPATPFVIKLGGAVLEPPHMMRELAASLAELAAPAVIVHGGGREVSDWCRRLGRTASFEGGLRVTDAATLEVAAAVLRGLANARIVVGLRAAGIDAVGLSALDGGLADVELHAGSARLGRVGVAAGIHVRLLERLLESGFTPVVSSIGARGEELLNLNADELAGAIAAALRTPALVMLCDVDGLRIDGALVHALGEAEVPAMLARDDVRDGMIPKLEAAARALAGGASRAVIAAWHGRGTLEKLLAGGLPATTVWPTRSEATHA